MISLEKKKFLDRFLGKVLCCLLSPILALLKLFLHFDHSLDKNKIRNIVLAKYYGLGSIVHSTGLLRELKKTYPEARIIYLTRKSNDILMKHLRFVDEFISIDDSSIWNLICSILRVILKLQKKRVDLYFDLEVYSCFSALMSVFSLAHNRIGFFAGRSSDYKSFLYDHLVYMNNTVPIRTCYLQLGKAVGVALDASSDLDELDLSDPAVTRQMEKRLNEIDPGSLEIKKIAVNVNASELSLARRWNKEKFAEICRIYAMQGYHVYLIGSPGEYDYVQAVRDLVAPDLPVFNVAGKFPFSEFLVFLKSCDLLLTNDSGLMNIGFCLKMKVVSLWGPCQPVQYHVASNWTSFLRAEIYCSPCLHIAERSPCSYYEKPLCMNLITTEEVRKEMDKLLAVDEPLKIGTNKYDFCSEQKTAALGTMYSVQFTQAKRR